jgi:hypothetical protein
MLMRCKHCNGVGIKFPAARFVRSPFGEHPCPYCGYKARFFISPWLILWPLYALLHLSKRNKT